MKNTSKVVRQAENSLPGMNSDHPQGHLHPITQTINHIVGIFHDLGFGVEQGPEIETEANNFDKLNIPKDHPARDMWDTFWFKPREKGMLLRTHTSPVQVRFLERMKKEGKEPPFAIVVPGKTYRYEATDATHEMQFHQVEGLMVGTDITLAHLKGVLDEFFKELLGKGTKTRFRPGYFPFVEPGVEVDVSCFSCAGKGCNICKMTGWIEIMGAGMVHPYVFNSAGYDPRAVRGFAFGMGAERLTMLRHGIPDIRLFNSGDLRFINQF